MPYGIWLTCSLHNMVILSIISTYGLAYTTDNYLEDFYPNPKMNNGVHMQRPPTGVIVGGLASQEANNICG